MKHRELEFHEYISIARRRVWWIAVPAVLMPVLAVLVTPILPKRFVSQALVAVEQQRVSDEYVNPLVNDSLDARLATMKQGILSRNRLEPVLEKFDIFARGKKKPTLEEKLALMRNAIAINIIRPDAARTGGLSEVSIAFTAQRPDLAQQVCNELTSMFIAENVHARAQTAKGTADFLSSQLDDAKHVLDGQDARIAAFERHYLGQLPGEEQTNANIMTSLKTRFDDITQSIHELQQEKTYSESLLAQQIEAWQRASVDTSGTMAGESVLQQLQRLRAQLIPLRAHYTDEHPDVIKLNRTIHSLERHLITEQGTPERAAKNKLPEPPSVQQLRAKVRSLDTSIEQKKQEQSKVTDAMKTNEARIQGTPLVQEKYKELTRDHENAMKFYNELLNKKHQTEMARDLERRQQGEQFRILTPPSLPLRPKFPDWRKFALCGFVAGLGLGLTLIFLPEFRHRSVRNERDVEFYLEAPVLVTLPAGGNKSVTLLKYERDHSTESEAA